MVEEKQSFENNHFFENSIYIRVKWTKWPILGVIFKIAKARRKNNSDHGITELHLLINYYRHVLCRTRPNVREQTKK